MFWTQCVFSFVIGFLTAMLIYKRRIKILLVAFKLGQELNRLEWEELINKLNHSGPIKEASTVVGLINISLWGVSRCITALEELLKSKDWNTTPVIKELQMILSNELSFLYRKVNDYLNSMREHLKEFHHNQEHEDDKGNNK